MISISEKQPNSNSLLTTWRFELGYLNADYPQTFHTFTEAWHELRTLARTGTAGLYLLDRFALPGRPQLWGVGGSGIQCISRRPL